MGTDKRISSPEVILLVEDEGLVRKLAADFLKVVGFSVIEAVHVAHALALIDVTDRIDLVFTDVNMPGEMDGHFLADWLAQHLPLIPVLLTSGIDKPHIGSDGMHRRFIAKPYAFSDIERHIKGSVALID